MHPSHQHMVSAVESEAYFSLISSALPISSLLRSTHTTHTQCSETWDLNCTSTCICWSSNCQFGNAQVINHRTSLQIDPDTAPDWAAWREKTKSDKKSDPEAKPGIFCKDSKRFLDFVREERNLPGNSLVKIGLDSGQNSLKISASVFSSEDDNCNEFSNRGVKRIFILALLPNCSEDYDNLKLIIRELNFDFSVRYCSVLSDQLYSLVHAVVIWSHFSKLKFFAQSSTRPTTTLLTVFSILIWNKLAFQLY